MIRSSIILALALTAGSAQALTPPTQPPEERARQRLLPQSTDPIWRTFAHTQFTADLAKGVFVAQHPADVRALDGQEVTVTGFMLSTSILKHFSSFILTRYTPVCAFCPPGAPNEAVQVYLDQFVAQAPGPVTVKGKLHLESDGANGLFFRLNQAEIVAKS
jgi:hypothetical protein